MSVSDIAEPDTYFKKNSKATERDGGREERFGPVSRFFIVSSRDKVKYRNGDRSMTG